MTLPIPTDKQAFVHHPKKYGKKRLTKAFRVAGKKGSKMQKIFRYSISKKSVKIGMGLTLILETASSACIILVALVG